MRVTSYGLVEKWESYHENRLVHYFLTVALSHHIWKCLAMILLSNIWVVIYKKNFSKYLFLFKTDKSHAWIFQNMTKQMLDNSFSLRLRELLLKFSEGGVMYFNFNRFSMGGSITYQFHAISYFRDRSHKPIVNVDCHVHITSWYISLLLGQKYHIIQTAWIWMRCRVTHVWLKSCYKNISFNCKLTLP